MRLLKDMRTEGLTLKQNVLGRVFDPGDPNQVRPFTESPSMKEKFLFESLFLSALNAKLIYS